MGNHQRRKRKEAQDRIRGKRIRQQKMQVHLSHCGSVGFHFCDRCLNKALLYFLYGFRNLNAWFSKSKAYFFNYKSCFLKRKACSFNYKVYFSSCRLDFNDLNPGKTNIAKEKTTWPNYYRQ